MVFGEKKLRFVFVVVNEFLTLESVEFYERFGLSQLRFDTIFIKALLHLSEIQLFFNSILYSSLSDLFFKYPLPFKSFLLQVSIHITLHRLHKFNILLLLIDYFRKLKRVINIRSSVIGSQKLFLLYAHLELGGFRI